MGKNVKPPRSLTLVRHAKAQNSAGTDKKRPLNDRGSKQAKALGPLLRDVLGSVDVALVSGARRTRETAEYIGLSLKVGEVVVLDELYDASLSDVLDAIRSVVPDAQSVLVVGHEPTISQTARYLHDMPDDELGLEVRLGVSTATACVLDVPAWGEVDQGTCHLRAVVRPNC